MKETCRKRTIATCNLCTCSTSNAIGFADYDCCRLVREFSTAEAHAFVAPDGVVEYDETKDELDLVVNLLCTFTT